MPSANDPTVSHTPTPWQALDHDGCSYGDDAKRCVCDSSGARIVVADDEATAALIVRAVNAHDALVAAMERIAGQLTALRGDMIAGTACAPSFALAPIIAEARAALKLAVDRRLESRP